jgi:hypothetical protein
MAQFWRSSSSSLMQDITARRNLHHTLDSAPQVVSLRCHFRH